MVLPFLQAPGFDMFHPEEVVPEYGAGVGIEKGEKFDFALQVTPERLEDLYRHEDRVPAAVPA